jgi:hypothetical protein
MEILLL